MRNFLRTLKKTLANLSIVMRKLLRTIYDNALY